MIQIRRNYFEDSFFIGKWLPSPFLIKKEHQNWFKNVAHKIHTK